MTTQWLDTQDNAARINELHGEVQGAMRTALDKAIIIGGLLAQTKASLKHGEWGQWAEANLTFTIRTATSYMNLYEQRARLKSENVSDLATAYKMLREPKEAKPQSAPRTPDIFDSLTPDSHWRATQPTRFGYKVIDIFPSATPGYFYIGLLEARHDDSGGIAEGNKKPFEVKGIRIYFEHFLRDDPAQYEWTQWTTEKIYNYNPFLYDSHDDYMKREVLSWNKEAAQRGISPQAQPTTNP